MTNRPKIKGTAAESAVVGFLRLMGFPTVERRGLAGVNDRGDIAGLPGVVVEVKNHQAMDLAGWLDEALAEAQNAVKDWAPGRPVPPHLPVVWHKRRGKGSPGDWYVTMDGYTFTEFLREWTK